MNNHLLISDAAKEVQVESHVLRYWEEELKLPIKRNELGHRYYTQDDVNRFKQIKSMKERGLQLKAIKMILKNGKLDLLTQDGEKTVKAPEGLDENRIDGDEKERGDSCVESHEEEHGDSRLERRGENQPDERGTGQTESREEKAQRLQWIMQQLIRQAVQENNAELVQQIRESVLKELDYQFRMQEERDEEREKMAAERTESYYRKLDELLRKKSSGNRLGVLIGRHTAPKEEAVKPDVKIIKKENAGLEHTKKEKKKRHFVI